MRAFLRNLGLAALVAAALGGGLAAWQARGERQALDFAQRRIAFLEGERQRLGVALTARQQADETALGASRRQEIEAAISRLRELPFQRPVVYREIGREKLPEILRQKLAQQIPDREFADMGVAMAAMGLLPPGIDLQKTYLALLGEQIGAFYDQHSRELYTFSGRPLTNAANRVIMAHELTHALQDQHFGLEKLPLEIKGDDDRALAASALAEGDATLAMNAYMLGDLSAAAIKDSLASALTTDVRQLAATPRFLRETLLFPYLHGLAFCQALSDRGGWAALDAAYAQPPSSTAQILHPEKYLISPREEAVAIDFGEIEINGSKPFINNVLGEFGAGQLFTSWLHDDVAAMQAAAGWRGDRYLVYGDAKANSWVWKIACADEAAAQKFSNAAMGCLQTRYGISQTHTVRPAPFGPAKETRSYVEAAAARGAGREVLTCITAAYEVIVIDAQDSGWSAALKRFAPGIAFPP